MTQPSPPSLRPMLDLIASEAMNPTGALPVILPADSWHPDLGPAERAAMAAIMGATDPNEVTEGL